MISTALKKLADQYRLAVSNGMAYGYLYGSYVTLTSNLLCHRLSIYVGCANVPLAEGEELPPAAKCSAMIVNMVTSASGSENIYGLLFTRLCPAVVVNHSGSVVTVNFGKDQKGVQGLQRFVAELIPRITPYTAPLQCSCCGGHTGGQGYPVRIAADTVVPMHTACCQESARKHQSAASALPGILGAVLGALLGTAAWIALLRLTGLSALGCLAILLLTLGGYKLLRGKPGVTQLMTVTICMAAALIVGIIADYLLTFHHEYAAYGSVVSTLMRESIYMRVMFKGIFTDRTALLELLLNLAIGCVFVLIGAASGLLHYKGCSEAAKPQAMPGQA